MSARFLVHRTASEADVLASPLGRVIVAAHQTGASITYGDGYPAHHGGWWPPIHWNPAGVRVQGARP